MLVLVKDPFFLCGQGNFPVCPGCPTPDPVDGLWVKDVRTVMDMTRIYPRTVMAQDLPGMSRISARLSHHFIRPRGDFPAGELKKREISTEHYYG